MELICSANPVPLVLSLSDHTPARTERRQDVSVTGCQTASTSRAVKQPVQHGRRPPVPLSDWSSEVLWARRRWSSM